MDVRRVVTDAFAQMDIAVRWDDDYDSGVTLDPGGIDVQLDLKRYSLVTEDLARKLLRHGPRPRRMLLVVADRVTEDARTILTSNGAGYLDLRGHLALRTDRLMVRADVEGTTGRPQRSDALSGRAGLEVAVAILMQPGRPTAVRELARALGRSPSTVSAVLAALRRDEMVDADNTLTGTQLFWQVADRWPVERTPLVQTPQPGQSSVTTALHLGLDDPAHPGWALTDSAAALAYGARLALRSDQPLDFFVPDQTVVRRASTLLGLAAAPAQTRATVRVAPVPAAVASRVDAPQNPFEWPLAHPLFVALDLTQDLGRGRAVLDGWTPDEQWGTRVW